MHPGMRRAQLKVLFDETISTYRHLAMFETLVGSLLRIVGEFSLHTHHLG